MSDPIPQNKSELLALIDREWSALMKVVDQLLPEQMVRPDPGSWSPKDNLAHLTEWLKILIGYHMDKRPAHEVTGVAPEVTKDWDFNVMNAIFFERNRRRPADEVLAELKQFHARIVERLQSMPFEDLMKPYHADDPEKQPLLNWVLGNTSEHFAEHRAAIEKSMSDK